MAVFCWSIYNGATYYIDVFGKRFQNELEKMKREVQKWQNSPEIMTSPLMTPKADGGSELAKALADRDVSPNGSVSDGNAHSPHAMDQIPLLSEDQIGGSTGIDGGARDVAKERKIGDLPT